MGILKWFRSRPKVVRKVPRAQSRNSRLNDRGEEVLDPIPFAATLPIKSNQKTLEERIASMMREEQLRRQPDLGMDNDDEGDFDTGDEDQIYPFEKKFDQVQAAKSNLDRLEADYNRLKAQYRAKRDNEAAEARLAEIEADPKAVLKKRVKKADRTSKEVFKDSSDEQNRSSENDA